MISLYCPENLMFRERVESFRALWAREASSGEILSLARRIIRDFCTTESVMEVNLDERTRGKIIALQDEPTVGMFDAALVAVDRDIARSLQAFFVSDIFLTYFDNQVGCLWLFVVIGD